jgi:hypothetical protein
MIVLNKTGTGKNRRTATFQAGDLCIHDRHELVKEEQLRTEG